MKGKISKKLEEKLQEPKESLKAVPSALDRACAFRCINTALDLLDQSFKMMETARLLYPECPPKYYDKVYSTLKSMKYRVPTDTSGWEF